MRVTRLLTVCSLLIVSAALLAAQTAERQNIADPLAVLPSDRITAAINNTALVTLPGNIHPLATAANDAGAVPDSMPMQNMTLLLQRDPGQQAALDALNVAQQDSASPLYHHWLTPAEFAQHFGVSQNDINRITAWLSNLGFTVEEVPAAHMEIRFSGTAGQVTAAFHTAIHYYRTAEGTHYANASEQKIPQALAGVVAGVTALHDFKPRPSSRTFSHELPQPQPQYGGGGQYFMAPSDFYTIYDLNPLFTAGTNGTGVTIAVTAPCSANTSIVQTFWSDFVKANTTLTTVNYMNPSPCASGDDGEVYLDTEWSGAVAKNAQILLVQADSIFDSASDIVNNKLASIVTTSYGSCESANGFVNTLAYATLWQTGATLGISSFVSAGDSGAAGCDSQTESLATQGLGVNAICSSIYAICVGGTEFNEGSNLNTYWNPTTAAALSYIPEVAWNESGLPSVVASCPVGDQCTELWSSGGGFSIYGSQNAAFAKPSWQTGNSQTSRGVPDVAMSAAAHGGYLTCSSASQCGSSSSFETSSGTSAATPVFAGIMALVVQKAGPQGNPAVDLYGLAAKTGKNIFHDITSGTNSVPGLVGYTAAPGWDPVTGLGSVDANLLVTNWPGVVVGSGPGVSLSSTSVSFGNQIVSSASSSQSVTVTSTGTSALNISSITISGANAADFSMGGSCAAGSLASGTSCKIGIVFTPSAAGSRSATITITDNASPSTQTIQLTGTGVTPVSIGVTNQETTLTNVGNSCATIPTPTSNFIVSNNTVYLFFNAQVGPSDNLTVNWLPPNNGAALASGWGAVATAGNYCFPAPLDISKASGSSLGVWSVEVFDNSQPVFSLSFSVGNLAIVSNASYSAPVAAGSLVSLYPGASGLSLSSSSGVQTSFTSAGVLPTTVGSTSMTVNGEAAPFLYVDGGQINAEIPPDTAPGLATVLVTSGGTTIKGFVSIASVAPGLFTVAQHHDGSLVNSASPANAGEYITLYGTGQGPVSGTQTSGGVNPGLICTDSSTVTIGGQSGAGQYYFCGLSYFVGVTQINFLVPSGLAAGNQPVVWSVNGTQSGSFNIAVSGH